MSLILHDNITEGITPTVSNEDTGYEGINVTNWLLWDAWKPGATGTQYLTFDLGTATTADCFACYGHNLGTEGCTVKMRYSTNGSSWTEAHAAISPTGDEVIFQEFTSQSKRYWQLQVGSSTTDAYISVIACGVKTSLPSGMYDGFKPPVWGDVENINSISVDGVFLGRSNQPKPFKLSISQRNATQAFIRGDWKTFITHAQTYPFFFSWDETNYSGEAVYCWVDRDIKYPNHNNANYLTAKIDVLALRD